MDFVSGALWHFTAYSLMSHQFISLFINMLNAKMIWEALVFLYAQPLSPFLPIPLQMQGPSPLAVLPQGFFCLTIWSYCYLAFYGVRHLAFYTLCRTLKQPWRRNHIQGTTFVPGVEVQRASPKRTLHEGWVQSLFLCKVPGVLTPKPTPIARPRMTPRPGLDPLIVLLPCLLLQETACPFSGQRHKHQFPAQQVSHQRAACTCLTCHIIIRDALK